MKATVYSVIRTLEDVKSDFRDKMIPQGTIGTVVECYEAPEGYAIDLAIPNAALVGGFEYDNVVLVPEQFELVDK